MGSGDSRSKFEHGNIVLQTDKPYYAPGEIVTGKIYLYLQQAYPGNMLELEIYGKEKVEWVVKKNKNRNNYDYDYDYRDEYDILGDRYRRIKDKTSILAYTYPIYQFIGGTAIAGQYTFPFQVQLPMNVPSSCNYTNYDASQSLGKVKYSLEARLTPINPDTIQPMKFKQTLIVRQLPPPIPKSSSAEYSDEVNSCCCCCSSGTVRMRSQWDKTAYTPQETVRIMAEIDNSNVSKEITKIKIQLRQHILLNRSEKNVGYFTEDKTFSYSETIFEREFDGIGENQRTDGMERYMELPLNEYHVKSDKNKFSTAFKDQDDYYLGESIQPSTNGRLVQVSYTLNVVPEYNTVCVCSPPQTEIGLFTFNWNIQIYVFRLKI